MMYAKDLWALKTRIISMKTKLITLQKLNKGEKSSKMCCQINLGYDSNKILGVETLEGLWSQIALQDSTFLF